MNKPTLDELMEKVDSRYTLVVMAAKRARALTDMYKAKSEEALDKPVTTAFREIAMNKINYLRNPNEIV